MLQLNNRCMQSALKNVPDASIVHTKTHTVVSRGTYSCFVENIQIDKKTGQPEKAVSHKVLWDESRHYNPLDLEHFKLRVEVSMALALADKMAKKDET